MTTDATARTVTDRQLDTDVSSHAFWEPYHRSTATPSEPPPPNAVLVDLVEAQHLVPGRVLDLGSGRGGDALWLASRGWLVTAVDVSATAVQRLRDLAAAQGTAERIRASSRDLTRSLPAGTFELVTASYLHSPVAIDRDAVLRRAAERLGVGGRLLVVDHASTAPWSWADPGTRYPTPDQTWASIGLGEDFEPLVLAARERTATGPDGQRATVTDNVLLARRTSEQPFSPRAEAENAERLLRGARHGVTLPGGSAGGAPTRS